MIQRIWLGIVGGLVAIGVMAGVVMVSLAFTKWVGPWLQGLGVMTDKDAGAVGAFAFMVAGIVGIVVFGGALTAIDWLDERRI